MILFRLAILFLLGFGALSLLDSRLATGIRCDSREDEVLLHVKDVQSEEGDSIRVYSVSEAKPVPIPLVSLLNDNRKALNVYSICMKRGYYYITSDEQ